MFGCAASTGMALPADHDPDDWKEYQRRFITESGQVVESKQTSFVHSEGQSYGMLLAVNFSDRKAFDLIWTWTKSELQIRSGDRLLAWKWDIASHKATDMNNATDADIIVAWSLYLAFDKWHDPAYKTEADAIVKSFTHLLATNNGKKYLLPGINGFQDKDSIELNPSYLIFPAYRVFASRNSDLEWNQLYRNAVDLLRTSRFGLWGMAPDWLTLATKPAPSIKHKPYFSYDAIRIPLFAAWSGESTLIKPYVGFWDYFRKIPAIPDVVNLENDFVHLRGDFPSAHAIYQLSLKVTEGISHATFPKLAWQQNTSYYDASLILLTQFAWNASDHQKQ